MTTNTGAIAMIAMAVIFLSFYSGRVFQCYGDEQTQTERFDQCVELMGGATDYNCELCWELTQFNQRYDYAIDIKDEGDGTILLLNIRDRSRYRIEFDQLQEEIMSLNE